MFYQRFGQMLLDARLITAGQLQTAQKIQSQNPGKQLDEILISCGFLPESALYQALEQHLGIAHIDLCGISISKELAALVSESLAKKYTLVPVSADDSTIRLAMANPLDHQAADAVRLIARRNIVPMLASPAAIHRAMADLYGSVSAEKALLDLQTDEAVSPTESSDSPIDEGQEAAPTIRLVNRFLEYAVNQEASDIHLEPRER
jgi:type IV pilus assembly protein PilB